MFKGRLLLLPGQDAPHLGLFNQTQRFTDLFKTAWTFGSQVIVLSKVLLDVVKLPVIRIQLGQYLAKELSLLTFLDAHIGFLRCPG